MTGPSDAFNRVRVFEAFPLPSTTNLLTVHAFPVAEEAMEVPSDQLALKPRSREVGGKHPKKKVISKPFSG